MGTPSPTPALDAIPVLAVENLRTEVSTSRGVFPIIHDVSFSLAAREAIGVVGESGSGKSITCLSILRLLPPNARTTGGRILLKGTDLIELSQAQMRMLRSVEIAYIPQDPMRSLDPLFTVGQQISEAILAHRKLDRDSLHSEIVRRLDDMRIPSPQLRATQYPHELSGGMKQRVVGAIALSNEPSVIVADEPTTALDVTTQAKYLRLLGDLRAEFGLSLLLITHDFSIVRASCDRVIVMYAGLVAERGTVDQVMGRPAHPYTQALMKAVPQVGRRRDRLEAIPGSPPSIFAPATGCPFAPRCPQVMDKCSVEEPPEFSLGDGQGARCWLYEGTTA